MRMHARVPRGERGAMSSEPRWVLTISFAIARPSPVPPSAFVVKNGSAARAACSCVMPSPSSVTTNAT
jgi:hypothetical protein